ncbi:signal peptidase I [Pyrobaculum ferrireducens]|uniref:Signal peptidase I n=1 Tax=Pyrobaculum ferrireducens TaxID=1104324 RepID=G7VCD4_9CREN|nr:signal peptidase I [Pyrobaculum ferrireducens]AET32554.1 hypothetical protein P186_1121 [Pyrobaculum ferrireducens]
MVFLLPGWGGTVAVYGGWLLLFLALSRRLGGGAGVVSLWESLWLGMVAVAYLTVMGFFFGFAVVPSLFKPDFFAVSAALWGVKLLGVEALRYAVLRTRWPYLLKLAVSIGVGVFYGNTIYTNAKVLSGLAAPEGWAGFLISFIPAVFYNVLLAYVYMWGGFRQGLLLAAVVSGYWELSPVRLTSSLGAVGSVLQLVLYYGLYLAVSRRFQPLRELKEEFFASRWSRVLEYFFLVVAVAAAGSVLSLALTGHVPVAVVSGSMRPVYDVGDLVILKRTSDVAVGDVVAFVVEGQLVMHRIVAVTPDGKFVTKGDAVPVPDPWLVPREAVVGKAVYRIPLLGYPVMYIHTSGFNIMPLLASGLLGGIVINEVLKARRGRRLAT